MEALMMIMVPPIVAEAGILPLKEFLRDILLLMI
jgi:hypothetical protein